uniref:Uncharacterized protein n=1 Tax=Noctiluca scintillans TaxID=2966 RepID=A0A7S0ZZM4_NOCSC
MEALSRSTEGLEHITEALANSTEGLEQKTVGISRGVESSEASLRQCLSGLHASGVAMKKLETTEVHAMHELSEKVSDCWRASNDKSGWQSEAAQMGAELRATIGTGLRGMQQEVAQVVAQCRAASSEHSEAVSEVSARCGRVAADLSTLQKQALFHEWRVAKCMQRLQYLSMNNDAGVFLDSSEFELGSLGSLTLRLYPHGLRGGDRQCAVGLHAAPVDGLSSAPAHVHLAIMGLSRQAVMRSEEDGSTLWMANSFGNLDDHLGDKEDIIITVTVPSSQWMTVSKTAKPASQRGPESTPRPMGLSRADTPKRQTPTPTVTPSPLVSPKSPPMSDARSTEETAMQANPFVTERRGEPVTQKSSAVDGAAEGVQSAGVPESSRPRLNPQPRGVPESAAGTTSWRQARPRPRNEAIPDSGWRQACAGGSDSSIPGSGLKLKPSTSLNPVSPPCLQSRETRPHVDVTSGWRQACAAGGAWPEETKRAWEKQADLETPFRSSPLPERRRPFSGSTASGPRAEGPASTNPFDE